MEDRVVVYENGREVEADDIGLLGEVSALADDRVMAELFRLSTTGVAKGVLPYAMGGASPAKGIVEAAAGARTVAINPFRAVVGIRADADGDGKKMWRDIRSVISPKDDTMTRTATLAENVAADGRWDLVYATVAVDAEVEETRYAKDPSSDNVTAASYVTKLVTTLEIGVVTGTAAPTPAFPGLPSDAGGNYNIPLAYVLVAAGAIALTRLDIVDAAPALPLAASTGAVTLGPATSTSRVTGALVTNAGTPVDGSNRLPAWSPPSMVGGVSRFFCLQLGTSATFVDGDVVDDSIDWRSRFCRWMASASGSATFFASDLAAGTASVVPEAKHGAFWGQFCVSGMGQTFHSSGVGPASPGPEAVVLAPAALSELSAGLVALYADTITGALKIFIDGAPDARIFLWLDATAQFPNY
jgi:hypothetical protein